MEDWFNFGVISAESRSLQLCHGSIFFPFGISNVEYFEHLAFLLSAPFNNHLYNNLAPALFARLAAKEGNTNLSLKTKDHSLVSWVTPKTLRFPCSGFQVFLPDQLGADFIPHTDNLRIDSLWFRIDGCSYSLGNTAVDTTTETTVAGYTNDKVLWLS